MILKIEVALPLMLFMKVYFFSKNLLSEQMLSHFWLSRNTESTFFDDQKENNTESTFL